MPEPHPFPRWPGAALLAVAFLTTLPAAAQTTVPFGEVVVSLRAEPRGGATHGYAEYLITVLNRSADRAHLVTLTLPQTDYSRGDAESIHAISRTVEVGPGTTVQVPLLQPDYPPVNGNGLRVYVDGREQDSVVNLSVVSGHGSVYHGGWGGPGHAVFKTASGPSQPLLLVSQRVGEKFDLRNGKMEALPSGMPGGPGVIRPGMPPPPVDVPVPEPEPEVDPAVPAPPAPPTLPGAAAKPVPPGAVKGAWVAVPVPGELFRSEEPIGTWSPRWLAYSRYDAIVLTLAELEGLRRGPADQQAVRTALIQYAEAGGVLVVLDRGPLTLPVTWQGEPTAPKGTHVHHAGFGSCIHVEDRNTAAWGKDTWDTVVAHWTATAGPFRMRDLSQANASLPILDDAGLPIRGLFVLMIVFVLAIGPGNLYLLSRWQRRIWLLWTVPLISLCTCATVFGYVIVSEGWYGRTRVVAFTLLDEGEQRATSLGQSASYAPLTPADGLHFSLDTEVMVQGAGTGSQVACEIDWTRDQHLRRGWMAARVPAIFQLRRSELKRKERLAVSPEADGTLAVTNQLGAPIRDLWVADAAGKLHHGGPVAVGQRASLTPTGQLARGPAASGPRGLYNSGEWTGLGERVTRAPHSYLGPRTYLAVLETSPFLEPGFVGAAVRPTDSYVLGLMAPGE